MAHSSAIPPTKTSGAVHGGQFFYDIGVDFSDLGSRDQVVNSDVLDAWYSPAPAVLEAVREALPWLAKTSPPVQAEGLVGAISMHRGVPKECVVVGAGSSSLIYAALPLLIGPDDRIVMLDPTYGEYPHVAERVIGANVDRFRLSKQRGFQVDVDAFLEDCRGAKAVLIVNPNSPTGGAMRGDQMRRIVREISQDTLVWIDETYIDFFGAEHSLERTVCELPNVIVCKSMSKYYALSGLRVGYLAAPPDIATNIRLHMPPWPVSLVGQVAGVVALQHDSYYAAKVKETTALRSELAESLSRLESVNIYPGVANFILVEVTGPGVTAADVVEHCARKRVHLRDCNSMGEQGLSQFLRVAVKNREDNVRLTEAIAEALSAPLGSTI